MRRAARRVGRGLSSPPADQAGSRQQPWPHLVQWRWAGTCGQPGALWTCPAPKLCSPLFVGLRAPHLFASYGGAGLGSSLCVSLKPRRKAAVQQRVAAPCELSSGT